MSSLIIVKKLETNVCAMASFTVLPLRFKEYCLYMFMDKIFIYQNFRLCLLVT